jgi:hypothetical protein
MEQLSATQALLWGLANAQAQGDEGGYAVRHGRIPAQDFALTKAAMTKYGALPDLVNFWAMAYPSLFPYGEGGIGARRVTYVSFLDHVRYCLAFHDGRFRQHATFAFHAFGIETKRQALRSARVQMERAAFKRDAHLLASLTAEDLALAEAEESANKPITSPRVRALKASTFGIMSRVTGSDAARQSHRRKIWGTSIACGPPSVWLTVNPDDQHNPIAQVFVGEDIDLDAFVRTDGPGKDRRAQNIAQDPHAAALFFNFIITAMFETLIGMKATQFKVTAEKGIFGIVRAYYALVESQGRGTLHLHALIWLEDTPSADVLNTAFRSPLFRDRVAAYISRCFRSHVPGIDGSRESAQQTPPDNTVAWCRPPNPSAPDYDEQVQRLIQVVTRTKQVHKCTRNACLVQRNGKLTCKRRAPWPLSDIDTVDEHGKWFSKRSFGYLATFVPDISQALPCNNNGQLLTNSKETLNISFYVCDYATKKQNKSHNSSAVLAQGFAYHSSHSQSIESARDRQRLLLFRAANALNREQELAAPMVHMYLLGFDNFYASHKYSTIFWSSFSGALRRAYPGLVPARLVFLDVSSPLCPLISSFDQVCCAGQ